VFRRPGLSVAPRFLWECLISPAVNPSPAPATSNGAGGFPALRSPARFTPRLRRPTKAAALSAVGPRPPPTPPGSLGSAFPLAYIPRLRSCRAMGAFITAPLPPVLPVELQTAGPLRSTGVTPLRRYYGPIRHPLAVSRLPGAAGYTAYPASADFAAGRGGLLQLLAVPWSPCCRSSPRRSDPPHQSVCDVPCSLRPSRCGLGLRGFVIFGATARSLSLRPGDSHPSRGWACQWASGHSVSLLPAIQLRGFRLLPRRD